jgi:hypothetical protein
MDHTATPAPPSPGSTGELSLLHLDDLGLAMLAESVKGEQQRRALAAEDLSAVVDDAFARGFDGRGMAADPWLTPGGLAVCPGSMVQRSRQSHRCRFVAVGDTWVWESPERVLDEVRPLHDGHDSLQTVTVLAAWDGLVLDVVTSRCRSGIHTRDSSAAIEVRRGLLVPCSSTAQVGAHR